MILKIVFQEEGAADRSVLYHPKKTRSSFLDHIVSQTQFFVERLI